MSGGSPGAGGSRQPPIWIAVIGAALCLFTLAEVNYPNLQEHSRLALFSLAGLVLCFLVKPAHRALRGNRWARAMDFGLVGLTVAVWGYIVVQSEPRFRSLWSGGQALGNRAGQETSLDFAVGILGVLLVLEATRRSIGLALPLLASLFIAYALIGNHLPDWLLPHRGYGLERVVSQTFLHSQGVFGVALRVMFTYVFLFVLFGAFLERTGATGFIIDLARRAFRNSPGGAAKVAVLSSGLMGSLSGSAVANTATTGTFTIPMMRSSGFSRENAAGVEAAASSGGALVPPVMGAGAYMMLEIIDPPVTYLLIIRAALIPALLYYLSLFLIVHFQSRRVAARALAEAEQKMDAADGDPMAEGTAAGAPGGAAGLVFVSGFAGLLVFLFLGYTAFRAVTLALGLGLVVSALSPATRLGGRKLLAVCARAARDVIPLVSAAACVGLILGVVTLTGVGTRFPSLLLPLAEESLLLALVAIMISSLVLGMGLPSAVCYLLLATLIGPVLGGLGVVPLSAHLFIFYFGMMSMVTPPVALAAYTAASIAGAGIMRAGLAAFRFALVGFTLPFMFVFRPQLLMLDAQGETAGAGAIALAVFLAIAGIVPFAAAIAGHLFTRLAPAERLGLFAASALLLLPGPSALLHSGSFPLLPPAGLLLLVVTAFLNRRRAGAPTR